MKKPAHTGVLPLIAMLLIPPVYAASVPVVHEDEHVVVRAGGQTVRDIARAHRDVDAKFVDDHLCCLECRTPCLLVCAHRQYERIKDHILGRNAQTLSSFKDLGGDS